jgi:hypothetical protein
VTKNNKKAQCKWTYPSTLIQKCRVYSLSSIFIDLFVIYGDIRSLTSHLCSKQASYFTLRESMLA